MDSVSLELESLDFTDRAVTKGETAGSVDNAVSGICIEIVGEAVA